MAGVSVLIPALLCTILILSKSAAGVSQLDHSHSVCRDEKNGMILESQEMTLKIDRLESILEESIQSLNAKIQYLEEKGKLIEEMTHKIDFLQSSLIAIKGDSTYAEERINTLEKEVRLLWDASRKNNFDLHILESKARDVKIKLEAVTSQVEQVGNIVTEQWIQIRQLDQALKVTEIRTLEAQTKMGFTRCTFVKFIKDFSDHHLPKVIRIFDPHLFSKKSILGSYMSQALHQFKGIMSAAKKYHHEGFVKQEMERNEFTASLANQEVVFFVASALITLPLLSAWMLLLSHFS